MRLFWVGKLGNMHFANLLGNSNNLENPILSTMIPKKVRSTDELAIFHTFYF